MLTRYMLSVAIGIAVTIILLLSYAPLGKLTSGRDFSATGTLIKTQGGIDIDFSSDCKLVPDNEKHHCHNVGYRRLGYKMDLVYPIKNVGDANVVVADLDSPVFPINVYVFESLDDTHFFTLLALFQISVLVIGISFFANKWLKRF